MSQAFTSHEDILNFFKTRGFEESIMTKESFCRLLDHLLPGKFPAQVVETLWKDLSNLQEAIAIHSFLQYFAGIQFRSQNDLNTQVAKHLQRTSLNDIDNVLGIPTLQTSPKLASTEHQAYKLPTLASIGLIVDKLRRILKSRGIANIRNLFGAADTTNLVEFKNVLKKIGLANKEIEKLYEALTPGKPNEYTGLIDLKMLSEKIARIE